MAISPNVKARAGDFMARGLTQIRVKGMSVQPSSYKPLSLKPVELEVLRLKRAKIDITVTEDHDESRLLGILEFHGRVFTLTRKSGNCDVGEVVDELAEDFVDRYGKEGLRILCTSPNRGECETIVSNAREFYDYLHAIKNRGGITSVIEHV